MDPVRNPYSPGAGTPPPVLVGRDEELELFDIALQRLALGKPARSLLLTGLRGTGKTVLLRAMGQRAKGYRWTHQHMEATAELEFADAMAVMVRKALLRLSAGQRLAARGRRAFGVLKSFQVRWRLPVISDVTIGIETVPGAADSGSLEDDLADVLTELGEFARASGSGVVFTIDEVQYLTRENLAALIVSLHHVSQEQLPLLVVAAGLPSVPALAGEAKSYAERLFTFREVNSLASAAAAEALETPARDEGVKWTREALATALKEAHGYPYFLQEFGKHAWDVAAGPDTIRKPDVDAALRLADADLDSGFFRVRVDRTTDRERAYLCAMASLGAGPYGSAAVAEVLHKTSAQAAMVRSSLIDRGICYSPRRGFIAFTVPMFDRFIRRHFSEAA